MARKKDSSAKEPGRLKQMWQVFKMTRRYDKRATWYILIGLILPVLAGVGIGLFLAGGNIFTLVLWIVVGVMAGVLIGMIILGRRAERAAYSQILGKPGAVGAVLRSSLKRGWTGTEDPVAVNPKTSDAVYSAVGRGGVVLIVEGSATRTKRMVDEERRLVARTASGVPITVLHVGAGQDAVPLHKLAKRLGKIKRAITKAEVLAVANRLQGVREKRGLPIPKGVDPMKARSQRAR